MSNSENFALNEKSGILKIFAQTFKIVKNNLLNIFLLVFLCFILMWATSYLFRFARYDIGDQTINMVQYYKTLFIGVMINFLQIAIKFFIFLSLLRIIDKHEKWHQALVKSAKIVLPIIFTETLIVLLIGFIPTIAISFPIILAFAPLNIAIGLIIISSALIIFLLIMFLRVLFCAAITLLDHKRYFETVKISWKYTKGNLLSLTRQFFLPIFIYFTFIYTMSVILPLYFNIMINSFDIAQKILNFIAPPIFIIYYYNIYKIYRNKYDR